jgi:hypothetical protein
MDVGLEGSQTGKKAGSDEDKTKESQ